MEVSSDFKLFRWKYLLLAASNLSKSLFGRSFLFVFGHCRFQTYFDFQRRLKTFTAWFLPIERKKLMMEMMNNFICFNIFYMWLYNFASYCDNALHSLCFIILYMTWPINYLHHTSILKLICVQIYYHHPSNTYRATMRDYFLWHAVQFSFYYPSTLLYLKEKRIYIPPSSSKYSFQEIWFQRNGWRSIFHFLRFRE